MKNLSEVEICKVGVLRRRTLYLRSTLNVDSENISIDYDSTRHVFENIAEISNLNKILINDYGIN